MVKRVLKGIAVNVDIGVALLLSILVGLLDIAGVASASLIDGAIILTLAALAAGMLHNRLSGESGSSKVEKQLSGWFGNEAVKLLKGVEIAQELTEARRNSDSWEFKGGTGIYNRAVTLPELAEKSRRDRRPHSVSLEILDPTDIDLCRRYDEFFAGVVTSSADTWKVNESGDGTRRQLFATILAACWYQNKCSLLEVDVRLSATMSILRWDLSPDRLIISHREPRYPALLIRTDNQYFSIWKSELHVSRRQAKRVPIELAQQAFLDDRPHVAEVRKLFNNLGIELPGEYSDDAVGQIIDMSLDQPDPYGSVH